VKRRAKRNWAAESDERTKQRVWEGDFSSGDRKKLRLTSWITSPKA